MFLELTKLDHATRVLGHLVELSVER